MTNLQYLLAMIYVGDNSLSHEDERKARALIQQPKSTSMNVPMQPELGSPIIFWLLDFVSSSYPQKKLRLIQMLLETMPIDIKNPEGRTPLLYVLQRVHSPGGTLGFTEDLVCMFLEAGASVHARSEDGMTALHAVCQLSMTGVAHDFTSRDCIDTERRTYTDIEGRVPKMMQMLLQHGADVTATDKHGHTPRHYAVLNGWEKELSG
ncbi:ankyrin repeat-containing domain protein [Podospora appendiculata]|uniref:Ankyrin repeat-containing domain protein n=1 Tax=Podospora appendiculata TaxID=314037 RepID=A0AAE0XCH0_9PEZI|nr:ankyrin repeat-containing domain protein [Podospora appendiculata]